MQAVDTKGIAPMSHAQDVSQRLREDVVTETDQRELFQSIAPQMSPRSKRGCIWFRKSSNSPAMLNSSLAQLGARCAPEKSAASN